MKRIISIFSIIICVVIVSMALVTIFGFFNDSISSEFENRALAEKPQLSLENWLSGNYSYELEEFLSDHVYNREGFIKAAHDIEKAMRRASKIRIVTVQ